MRDGRLALDPENAFLLSFGTAMNILQKGLQ
jgi:hypothetical protein